MAILFHFENLYITSQKSLFKLRNTQQFCSLPGWMHFIANILSTIRKKIQNIEGQNKGIGLGFESSDITVPIDLVPGTLMLYKMRVYEYLANIVAKTQEMNTKILTPVFSKIT